MIYSLSGVNVPAAQCLNCYQLVRCDDNYTVNLVNPTLTDSSLSPPTGNPDNYLGVLFKGALHTTDVDVPGCWTLTKLTCDEPPSGTINAEIQVEHFGYTDCLTCGNDPGSPPPPEGTWKITRCDDDGIFYLVNTDLTAVLGSVIKGVVIQGCGPNTLPCNVKPEQCWTVSKTTSQTAYIDVLSYTDVYPDCQCCKTPC